MKYWSKIRTLFLVLSTLLLTTSAFALPEPPADYGSVIVEEVREGFRITFTNQADDDIVLVAREHTSFPGWWYRKATSQQQGFTFLLSSCTTKDPDCITHVVTFDDLDDSGTLTLTDSVFGKKQYRLERIKNTDAFAGTITLQGETFKVHGSARGGEHPRISVSRTAEDDYHSIIGLKGKKLLIPKPASEGHTLYFTDPNTGNQYPIHIGQDITVTTLEFYPFDSQTLVGAAPGIITYKEDDKLAFYYQLDTLKQDIQDISLSRELCLDFPTSADTSRKARCLTDLDTLNENSRAFGRDEGIIHTNLRQFQYFDDHAIRTLSAEHDRATLEINGQIVPLATGGSYTLPSGIIVTLHAAHKPTNTAYIQLKSVRETFPSIEPSQPTGYPHFFSENGKLDAIVVVGDKAPSSDVVAASDIMTSLQEDFPATKIGTTRLASTVPSLGNMIAIGSPCDNPITSRITGKHDCDLTLKPGQGYIGFYERSGYHQVVVAGHGPQETRLAARVLAQDPSFDGDHFLVEGTAANPTLTPLARLPLDATPTTLDTLPPSQPHQKAPQPAL